MVEMMAANPIVLPPFLLSSSICLIAHVDSSLYLLNLFDTFNIPAKFDWYVGHLVL
jgi:hypothetical protein